MCDEISCGYTPSDKPLPKVTDDQRRAFVKGLAALPLATVLAYPDLAKASGENATKPISIDMPGGKKAMGHIAMPKTLPAPTVLLIHEWWGLNDQIKSVAAEFAKMGYIAVAADMYRGEYATEREGAMRLMKAMDPADGTAQLVSWVNWLKNHKDSTGKVGTVGWCFGGGWSLNASIATPVDATVIYYGRCNKSANELKSLNSPVLGHFGTQDKSINAEMVGGFEKAMAEAGKTDLTVHWYDANHAFANPTGSRYDEDDAKLAWERTSKFFEQHLM